jgi:hypothetical protein
MGTPYFSSTIFSAFQGLPAMKPGKRARHQVLR